MARKLKLWNGRPYGVLTSDEWKDRHVYVAAYSIADARKVCVEAGCNEPSVSEIVKYWNKGSWGVSMDGVTPERGLWVVVGQSGKPERRMA